MNELGQTSGPLGTAPLDISGALQLTKAQPNGFPNPMAAAKPDLAPKPLDPARFEKKPSTGPARPASEALAAAASDVKSAAAAGSHAVVVHKATDVAIRSEATPEEIQTTLACVNSFGPLYLAQQLKEKPNESAVFFPASALEVAIILTCGMNQPLDRFRFLRGVKMVGENSSDIEIATVLEGLAAGFRHLKSKISRKGPEAPVVTTRTAICGAARDAFREGVKHYFSGEVIKDGSYARSWIEEQITHKPTRDSFMDLIADILREMEKNQNTSILQMLYMHFKLGKSSRFVTEKSGPKDFRCQDGSHISVRMMYQENSLPIYQHSEFTVVELPFDGEEQSCLIFIPKDPKKIGTLQQQIPELLRSIDDCLSRENVKFEMPKIRVEEIFDLLKAFVNIGLLDKRAVYGLIGDDKILGKLRQSVLWTLDETESRAAVLTDGQMYTGCPMPRGPVKEPLEISADRPFILCLTAKVGTQNLCLLQTVFNDAKFFVTKETALVPHTNAPKSVITAREVEAKSNSAARAPSETWLVSAGQHTQAVIDPRAQQAQNDAEKRMKFYAFAQEVEGIINVCDAKRAPGPNFYANLMEQFLDLDPVHTQTLQNLFLTMDTKDSDVLQAGTDFKRIAEILTTIQKHINSVVLMLKKAHSSTQ